MRKIFMLLILILTIVATNFISVATAANGSSDKLIVSQKENAIKLGNYYLFDFNNQEYKIAVESYKGGKRGKIKFKLNDIQKGNTFLVKAEPLNSKCIISIKNRMMSSGWSQGETVNYPAGSLFDIFVLAACAVAREAGCFMSATEVGGRVMSIKMVNKEGFEDRFVLTSYNG